MKILFAEPPPEQAVGGLELAIDTLYTYLRQDGVAIRRRVGAAILMETDPDVVHFHGLWQPEHAWMSFWCRRRGIPYVVSPHGMLEPWAWNHKAWKKKPYFALVERWHLNGARRVLATSEQEQQNLRPFVSGSEVEAIPLSLSEDVGPGYSEARRALGWPEDERVLLYLSRVHPKKGLHLLLEALVAIPETEQQKTRVVVVGPGPDDYVQRVKQYAQARAARLPPVQWEGPVWGDDKWIYLQGADLMCLPTYSENFGIVVLEACQVGTPVLTTNTTPWSFLKQWEGGYVVDPEVPAIQAALNDFYHHFTWTPEKRQRLAEKTRRRFDVARIGPRYLDVYRKILDGCTG